MVGAGAVIAPDTVVGAGARIEPGETFVVAR
jgi:acetyltransferase-like isoleucine patch superfamily enzyme